jgi:titin
MHRTIWLFMLLVVLCVALAPGSASSAPLYVLVVTSTGDGADSNLGDGICDDGTGSCTLRAAVEQANANGSGGAIYFAILSGPHTIVPGSPLPAIAVTTDVDGTTQPGFSGTPIIALDGANAGSAADGVAFAAGNGSLRGLVIHGFQGAGVALRGGDHLIAGNYIGTDAAGKKAVPNGTGVAVLAGRNLIGGSAVAARNVISGNSVCGVAISGAATAENRVTGNYIGTNAAGTAAIGTTSAEGVTVTGSSGNVIGDLEAGNVIAGENGCGLLDSGIQIFGGSATDNRVQHNYIGTNAAGTAAVGSFNIGVLVIADRNLIGGTVPNARNVISGNASGIDISGSLGALPTGNQVQGNYIGTNAAGTAAIPNSFAGVAIVDAPGNTIGGTAAGARNVISGNAVGGNGRGVIISLSSATNNEVLGNYIGTDAGGTVGLGNFWGVEIFDADNNTIGGTVAAARNVISGNASNGVLIENGATGNQVRGNFIGTNAAGTAAVANGGGVSLENAPANTIGGTAAGAGNVISGNSFHGVQIFGSGASGNQVQGNLIGTDAAGLAALGNGTSGVRILASSTVVGGAAPGAANLIEFNAEAGVSVESGTGNSILSNSIYANGGLGIDLFPSGVTPNDPGDLDTGANDLQNFPSVGLATSVCASICFTRIPVTLDSTPNTQFRLEFFSNPVCDPSGNGEGSQLIGSTSLTTGSGGSASTVVVLPVRVPGGSVVTATATDPAMNTSEFSNCAPVRFRGHP